MNYGQLATLAYCPCLRQQKTGLLNLHFTIYRLVALASHLCKSEQNSTKLFYKMCFH